MGTVTPHRSRTLAWLADATGVVLGPRTRALSAGRDDTVVSIRPRWLVDASGRIVGQRTPDGRDVIYAASAPSLMFIDTTVEFETDANGEPEAHIDANNRRVDFVPSCIPDVDGVFPTDEGAYIVEPY